MKRKMPATLKSFLANNASWYAADCFSIALPNGQAIHATTGQWDITFRTDTPGWGGPQTTFRTAANGAWSRGDITSQAGFGLSSNSMDLNCSPDVDTVYPGTSLSILAAAHLHLFDGAKVAVYAVYMPIGSYGDVSVGIETKFEGVIIRNGKLSRPQAQFEVADYFFVLNMKVPSRVLQTNCPHGFADENCGLNPGDYTQTLTANPASTSLQIVATSLPQPNGYFAQGVLTCLTGANAGLSQTVKTHASGVLTMMSPWLLPVSPGDTFSAIKGCDKTPSTCAGTVRANGTPESNDFRTRFGGQPFTPPPTAAI